MGVMIGAVLLSIGVVLFLLLPILRGERASFSRTRGELTDAEARKRAAVRALRDVEYDYQTGKLDDTDYSDLKTALSRDALRAIERVDQEDEWEAGAAGIGVARESGLEAEIARARAGLRAGPTCEDCGEVNVAGSRFCIACGHAFPSASEAPQA
jgi:cytochrome c-type biogenesis protein CcmI